MITPEQFQEIGETLLPLLDELTEWIMQDMIERFMIRFGRGEKKLLTGTDEWQAWVLEQAGGNLDEIQKALAKSTGKSQQEIAKIFKDSGIQAAKADAALGNVHIEGISATAFSDGAECIAEVEVLLSRNAEVPKEAKALYDKYIRGGRK